MEPPQRLCLNDLNGFACPSPSPARGEKGETQECADLHVGDRPAAKAEWRRKGDVGVCPAHTSTGCPDGETCKFLHVRVVNKGRRPPPGLDAANAPPRRAVDGAVNGGPSGAARAPPRRRGRHPPPRGEAQTGGAPPLGQDGGPRLVSAGVRLASQLRGKVKTADGALEGLEKLALSLPDSSWPEAHFVSSRTKEELDVRMRDLVAAYEALLRSMRTAPGPNV